MKYDKVKADQMVGNNTDISACQVNKILDNLDTLATYPVNTPLQNFRNVLLCMDKLWDIAKQAEAAALNQLRVEKPELFKDVNYSFASEVRQKEMDKIPYMEYEGCKFRVGVFPDFGNLARKDEKLANYIRSGEDNYKQAMKIYKYIIDRIRTLIKQKEYKKTKPRKVNEMLQFDGVGCFL